MIVIASSNCFYQKLCTHCGNKFSCINPDESYCHGCRQKVLSALKRAYKRQQLGLPDDCRRGELIAANRKANGTNPRVIQTEHYVKPKQDKFSKILKEVDTYNKRHGTCLSYGQYLTYKETGRLK